MMDKKKNIQSLITTFMYSFDQIDINNIYKFSEILCHVSLLGFCIHQVYSFLAACTQNKMTQSQLMNITYVLYLTLDLSTWTL